MNQGSSDDAMTDFIHALAALIEERKLGMSNAELIKARAFVASIAVVCAEAAQHCDRMGYSDERARDYMRGLLRGIVERHQLTVTFVQEALH